MSSIWKYKYFVDVIESKSFTKAGNMNYVSQTAISQNISSLQLQRAEGGGETAGEGLMFNGYQPISCDEVDGMITLLDRFAGKKRTLASFCSGRGLIQNGQEVPPAEPLSDRLAERLLPLIRH